MGDSWEIPLKPEDSDMAKTGCLSFAGKTNEKNWPPLLSIILSMSLPGRQSALRNKVKNSQCLTWFLEIVLAFSLMILSKKKWREWHEEVGSGFPVMNGSKLSKRVATECDHWLMISALRKVGGQQEKGVVSPAQDEEPLLWLWQPRAIISWEAILMTCAPFTGPKHALFPVWKHCMSHQLVFGWSRNLSRSPLKPCWPWEPGTDLEHHFIQAEDSFSS